MMVEKPLLCCWQRGGYTGLVERAIYAGVDITKKDKNGKTALDLARDSGVLDEHLEALLTPKQADVKDRHVEL